MDIQKYAFRKYKIKTVENGHTHLAPEELEKNGNFAIDWKIYKIPEDIGCISVLLLRRYEIFRLCKYEAGKHCGNASGDLVNL